MAFKIVSGGQSLVPPPRSTRQVIGTSDGSAWTPQGAGVWIPRVEQSLPRRKPTNVLLCDSLTGVTGTAGTYSLDATQPGMSPNGSIKLTAPATTGGFNEVVVPLPSTWGFGDGITPTAYLRCWFMVDDDRDRAHSSLNYGRFALGTAAGLTNSIYQDVGPAQYGDGSPNKLRSRLIPSVIVMPMLQSDATGSSDMPPTPNTASGAWQLNGTGFVAADWNAVTQVRLRLSGKAPADGSAYIPPTMWLLGVERVPLPPFALLSFQFDWTQYNHVGVGAWMHANYGIVPLLNCFPTPFRGTQDPTTMDLATLLNVAHNRNFETSLYAFPNTSVPPVDGSNNFGGGDGGTVPGVPWSQVGGIQAAEDIINECQAYFAENNLSGHDILLGQERKLRDADGLGLLRKYSSFGIQPVAGEGNPAWWPSDTPLQHPTMMVDTTWVIDNGDGTFSSDARWQRSIRRAIKNREWLRILIHAVQPDGSASSGVQPRHIKGLMDYAIAAGRFDGTAGKIVSHSEAMAYSRYAT